MVHETSHEIPEALEDIAAKFAAKVRAPILDLGINNVYNADQTEVRCSRKTKARTTVMLMGDSVGVKYRLFVVFKAKPSTVPVMVPENTRNTRLGYGFAKGIWKHMNVAHQERKLEIYGKLKAWWNSDLSKQFMTYHFAARRGIQVPILLIWDDFSGHWTPEGVSYSASINVALMEVPAGATFACQPAADAWNYPFKEKLRECWTYGNLLDDADVAAADLIHAVAMHCAIDMKGGEIDSDDDIGNVE
ncbi:NPP1 protein [Phytophthora cinnamomi]|uniref:NPP1 protein n=1 Tax=Phytophthora cinnamomi TaxID=4785 RepID=UPI00355960C1|nr:NPP1 protein [Phytophthora cinnamomi]